MLRQTVKFGGLGALAGVVAIAAFVLLNMNVAGFAASMESTQGSVYLSSHFCF
jgi:hypothetical protein